MHIGDEPREWEERRLIDLVSLAAAEYDDAPVLRFGDGEMTYAGLESRVGDLMEGLWSTGLRPGDRVGIVMEDLPEAIVSIVAASALGCPPLVLSVRNTPHELAYLLNEGGASTVMTQTDASNGNTLQRYDVVFQGRDEELSVPTLERVVAVSDGKSPANPASLKGIDVNDYRDLTAAGAQCEHSSEVQEAVDGVSPDDTALVLFTSGTTSAPKAVVRTHRNLLPHAVDAASWYELTPGEVLLNAYPIPSAAGVLRFLMTVSSGATCILQGHYTIETTMSYLREGAVTYLSGPDTIFKDILERPAAAEIDTGPLERIFLSMGGGLDVAFGEEVETTFETPVENAYGLTEANPLVLRTRREHPFEARVRPGGMTGYGTEVRLDGEGSQGEICIRGVSVTPGYENNEAATDSAFDDEGWFHTNDQGQEESFNGQEFRFFANRADAMFQVGGFNVSPVEVEACLREHPAVRWAGVAGIDHDRLGAVPGALVTISKEVDPRSLTEFCESRLSDQKVPRTIFVIDDDEVPYSTGTHGRKIDRAGIRDLLATKAEAAT